MEFDLDTGYMIVAAIVTVASVLLGLKWQLAKKKLSQVRVLIDKVDDALYDDNISEQEFRDIVKTLVDLVGETETEQLINGLKARVGS
ncbi:hypothetical protein [Candidatus Methanoperedens nitratireducens]|uniref:Uncharacterized protein n=1 Tax=Candidatus Methanoperedens nitratireducens TaxID=1392998 RepID=A0A284VM98_9EURY|nr:hypothetical protein [Candidatus Methanoperedens nitroreducens]SNQ60406.1 hypothetical protein MNV_180038 [Candidatus Methanoperedens nitroreducens]